MLDTIPGTTPPGFIVVGITLKEENPEINADVRVKVSQNAFKPRLLIVPRRVILESVNIDNNTEDEDKIESCRL